MFGYRNVFVANCSASDKKTAIQAQWNILWRLGYVTAKICRKIISKYYDCIAPFRWEGYFVLKEVCVVVKVLPTDMSLVLHLLYVFEFFDTYINKYKSWEKFDPYKLFMESVNKFLFCWHTFSTNLESCQFGYFLSLNQYDWLTLFLPALGVISPLIVYHVTTPGSSRVKGFVKKISTNFKTFPTGLVVVVLLREVSLDRNPLIKICEQADERT